MACDKPEKFTIRPLKEEECGQVHQMIIELAEFENMPDSVHITPEGLKEDIFGEKTWCCCLVAENVECVDEGKNLVGYAIYFFAYSTWERKFIHLEDLFVKPGFQGKGIGKRLYQAVVQEALDLGCPRVELEVLDWNKKAKDFYEKIGNENNTKSEGWLKMRMRTEEMKNFVKM